MAWSNSEAKTLTMSRLTEDDIQKFFDKSDKGYLMVEDIK
jgi:hypothetical protein